MISSKNLFSENNLKIVSYYKKILFRGSNYYLLLGYTSIIVDFTFG